MRNEKQFSRPAKPVHVSRVFLILTGVSLLSAAATGQQREPRFDNWEEPNGPIKTGMLFVNDEYIPGPYDVEVTQAEININGVKCIEIVGAALDQRDDSRRPDARRQSGFRGQQGQRGGGGGGDFGPRGRRGGGGRTERPGERIVSSLTSDGIVVVRTGAPTRYLDGKDMYTFCKAMSAETLDDEQIEAFALLAKSEEHIPHWKQWLHSFEPNTDLYERMRYEVKRSDTMVANADAKLLAVGRLERFTYPLTIAGMLLSVLALGHLLKWATRIVMAETATGESGDVIRCAEVALLLMLAMSALDLVWTILAGQAGIMREVNPLAATLLKTPMQLVLFKVSATGLGFVILYVWRRRAQIQQATWWMCLVCVLLTFRWVVFDSVVN